MILILFFIYLVTFPIKYHDCYTIVLIDSLQVMHMTINFQYYAAIDSVITISASLVYLLLK